MGVAAGEPCPLPDHPVLAEVAAALNAARTWAIVLDREWRLAYMTDDIRLSNGRLHELVPLPLGEHYFGAAGLEVMLAWSGRVFSAESWRAELPRLARWMIDDTPGGADALRELLDPRLRDVLDHELPAIDSMAITVRVPGSSAGVRADSIFTIVRLHDAAGDFAGTVWIGKPVAGMAVLGNLGSIGDLRHFERVQQLARAGRRPAAILFGDLEASSPLARRLSTANYFALGRRLVRACDTCFVEAGGMVGRHAGDGVVGFFLAQHAGSESAAARACIASMRELRARTREVAERSGLAADDVVLRFGLHWGSTLHIGQISTPARAEVDALGDEVNEAARIEACAAGGRALASKALIERLDPPDAAALGLDLGRIDYTALADLPTATDKARRDAPAIAVCEL